MIIFGVKGGLFFLKLYSVIKQIAAKRNISIYKLERELGFSNGRISKWDSGMPGADALDQVASYFGVSAEEILKLAKENKK